MSFGLVLNHLLSIIDLNNLVANFVVELQGLVPLLPFLESSLHSEVPVLAPLEEDILQIDVFVFGAPAEVNPLGETSVSFGVVKPGEVVTHDPSSLASEFLVKTRIL